MSLGVGAASLHAPTTIQGSDMLVTAFVTRRHRYPA